jgi:hypothetical protein
MVAMCYLATYGQRSVDNSEQLIVQKRRQVNPGREQREFVRDFIKKFRADETAKKLMIENALPE